MGMVRSCSQGRFKALSEHDFLDSLVRRVFPESQKRPRSILAIHQGSRQRQCYGELRRSELRRHIYEGNSLPILLAHPLTKVQGFVQVSKVG